MNTIEELEEMILCLAKIEQKVFAEHQDITAKALFEARCKINNAIGSLQYYQSQKVKS